MGLCVWVGQVRDDWRAVIVGACHCDENALTCYGPSKLDALRNLRKTLLRLASEAEDQIDDIQPIANVRSLFGTWPGEADDGFEESIDELRHGTPEATS